MSQKLPYFKYHPEPIKNGSLKNKRIQCSVCNQGRDYVYDGPVYCYGDVQNICPWCIKNGDAAKKYDCRFVADYEGLDKKENVDELIHRTPGFFTWQGSEEWPNHCGDFCAFVGFVGWKEIEHLKDNLKSDIEKIKESMDLDQSEFEKSLVNEGTHQGYLFKCLHCDAYRLTSDSG